MSSTLITFKMEKADGTISEANLKIEPGTSLETIESRLFVLVGEAIEYLRNE